ncbi:MAG: hypothetical protein EON54_04425 [Alcaligenaceae bacterium]|nr:MAG: hypothetical protein EON54_04425 [Alcaligenaceae bacterium]
MSKVGLDPEDIENNPQGRELPERHSLRAMAGSVLLRMSAKQLLERLVNAPLYSNLPFTKSHAISEIVALQHDDIRIDMYCPGCKQTSTWHKAPSATGTSGHVYRKRGPNYPYQILIQCRRDESHTATYFFTEHSTITEPERELHLTHIQKIGQAPSMSTFNWGTADELKSVKSKSQRTNMSNAVQSASYGLYAGACTYLRRIMEGLISEAKATHMKESALSVWPVFDQEQGFKERLALVKAHLPAFVTQNPQIYNVLSENIHTTSDDEAAAQYPKLLEALKMVFRDIKAVNDQKRVREDLAKYIAQQAQKP